MFNLSKPERLAVISLSALLLIALLIILHKHNRPFRKIEIGNFDESIVTGLAPQGGRPEYVVNINTANTEELMKLKGVGNVLAERIVEYRSSKGLFAAAGDIKKVAGIGEKLYEKIKYNIRVE